MHEVLKRYTKESGWRSHADEILSVVNQLGQFDLILAVWRCPALLTDCSPSLLGFSVVQAGDRLGWSSITSVIKELFASVQFGTGIDLLHAMVFADADDEKAAVARRALSAQILPTLAPHFFADPMKNLSAELLRLLWNFSEFATLDAAANALTPHLASAALAQVRTAVVPALRSLHRFTSGAVWSRPPLLKLFQTVVELLQAQVRSSTSWAIATPLACACEECTPVQSFLKSATDSLLSIGAAEPKRKHISKSVASLVSAGLLVTDTDKSVRPFRLVLSKQTAAAKERLERQASQQDKDATLVKQLQEMFDATPETQSDMKKPKLQM